MVVKIYLDKQYKIFDNLDYDYCYSKNFIYTRCGIYNINYGYIYRYHCEENNILDIKERNNMKFIINSNTESIDKKDYINRIPYDNYIVKQDVFSCFIDDDITLYKVFENDTYEEYYFTISDITSINDYKSYGFKKIENIMERIYNKVNKYE